jgi:tetratricopeptide (TPR) repeat protein
MNEFLIFVSNNPTYQSALDEAIRLFGASSDVFVAKEIGKFYHEKKNWTLAAKYYELAYEINEQDNELNILLLQSYENTQNFEALEKKAVLMIESFPLQPDLYLYAGVALNKKSEYKKAQNYLEMGLDYLVENKPLEKQFYQQLSISFQGQNDPEKAARYLKKATE